MKIQEGNRLRVLVDRISNSGNPIAYLIEHPTMMTRFHILGANKGDKLEVEVKSVDTSPILCEPIKEIEEDQELYEKITEMNIPEANSGDSQEENQRLCIKYEDDYQSHWEEQKDQVQKDMPKRL